MHERDPKARQKFLVSVPRLPGLTREQIRVKLKKALEQIPGDDGKPYLFPNAREVAVAPVRDDEVVVPESSVKSPL